MAWYRTAMLLQPILQELFELTTFVCVDDCFWMTPSRDLEENPGAAWQAQVFQYVVEYL